MPTKLILQSIPVGPSRPKYPTAALWTPLNDGASPFLNKGTVGGSVSTSAGTITANLAMPGLPWANPALRLDDSAASVVKTNFTSLNGANSFTFSFWSNLTTAIDGTNILSTAAVGPGQWQALLAMNYAGASGKLQFAAAGSGFTFNYFDTGISAADLTSGSPVFVVVTMDGNTGGPNPVAYSYLNGVQVGSKTYAFGSTFASDPNYIFGIGANNTRPSVTGYISNVVYTNTATSAADVLAQYNAGKP
jgi:hypothetical protein